VPAFVDDFQPGLPDRLEQALDKHAIVGDFAVSADREKSGMLLRELTMGLVRVRGAGPASLTSEGSDLPSREHPARPDPLRIYPGKSQRRLYGKTGEAMPRSWPPIASATPDCPLRNRQEPHIPWVASLRIVGVDNQGVNST